MNIKIKIDMEVNTNKIHNIKYFECVEIESIDGHIVVIMEERILAKFC